MEKPLLSGDEWIGFQVKEGPCSAGCEYCYERPIALELLRKAEQEGKIDKVETSICNTKLASLLAKNQGKIGLELGIEEIKKYFELLKEVGVNRTFLIGSEPTEHSNFESILDVALEKKLEVLVYTSGRNLQKLEHLAIKYIILHLDYSRLFEPKELAKKFCDRILPSDQYMQKINLLLDQGKEIQYRVNFSSPEMLDKQLVFSFYDRVLPKHTPNVLLKYSFTTRLSTEPNLSHFTPNSLKKTTPFLLAFLDEFKKRYPNTLMFSERPLFPCAFSNKVWNSYKEKGGFVSKCDMEFVVYPNIGLTFCPPARKLMKGEHIETGKQLIQRIHTLKKQFQELNKQPSFKECNNCKHRKNFTCQGGCAGYKDSFK